MTRYLKPMDLAGVVIGAANVAEASADYATLLGTGATAGPEGGRRFRLARGTVDVVAGTPGLRAVRFVVPAGSPVPADFHGIAVRVEDGPPPADERDAKGGATAIDHVVVFTPDPARAIALWRDAVGLRLALDRVFERRKLRLLFFRSAGMTLEYAHPLGGAAAPAGPDGFYGVSYRVPDVAARRRDLLAAGFDVSEVRPGMKPGTSVASVRNRTSAVPTLLIEHPPRPGGE